VWMTGYGNFSYFMKYKDYSPFRLCKMLFRLNFLVTMILMVMNTDYMLYYICPMHTLWFLSVYAMMAIAPGMNLTNTGICIKFAVYAIISMIASVHYAHVALLAFGQRAKEDPFI
jgi:N-acetylneuraminate 9-O-acetyltransferase